MRANGAWRLAATAAMAFLLSSLAGATILVEYDASTGAPSVPGDVVDPLTPAGGSWTPTDPSLGGTDIQEGVIDGGVPAWRNRDGTNNNNPGYRKALSASDFTAMHDEGWQYTVNTKMVQNAHFTAWGVTQGNDPGWELAARERSGFSLGISGDAMLVTPLGAPQFSLGAGSANSFHEFRNVGAADVSRFRTYIDGQFAGTWDFRDFSSNSSNDNRAMWASGSSGGDNREAYFNLVRLETTDEPWLEMFYDDFQSYAPGQGVTAFGPWLVTGETAGRASEIFNAGTGGAGINSRTWVTNDLTTIIADAGEAENWTIYEVSAMLAAGTSNSGALTDFELSLLIGDSAATASPVAKLIDSATGGNIGKGDFDRQFSISYVTGVVDPDDHLFIQIAHQEDDFFLIVDDVALWSARSDIPEPATLFLLGFGSVGLALRRRRRMS